MENRRKFIHNLMWSCVHFVVDICGLCFRQFDGTDGLRVLAAPSAKKLVPVDIHSRCLAAGLYRRKGPSPPDEPCVPFQGDGRRKRVIALCTSPRNQNADGRIVFGCSLAQSRVANRPDLPVRTVVSTFLGMADLEKSEIWVRNYFSTGQWVRKNAVRWVPGVV